MLEKHHLTKHWLLHRAVVARGVFYLKQGLPSHLVSTITHKHQIENHTTAVAWNPALMTSPYLAASILCPFDKPRSESLKTALWISAMLKKVAKNVWEEK